MSGGLFHQFKDRFSFNSGNVSVQPDLLCGQNRFPAHLDTPTTVDVASGAVASVENGEPGIGGSMDRANGLFDLEPDLNNDLEPQVWTALLI